jgi:hypothetical protein
MADADTEPPVPEIPSDEDVTRRIEGLNENIDLVAGNIFYMPLSKEYNFISNYQKSIVLRTDDETKLGQFMEHYENFLKNRTSDGKIVEATRNVRTEMDTVRKSIATNLEKRRDQIRMAIEAYTTLLEATVETSGMRDTLHHLKTDGMDEEIEKYVEDTFCDPSDEMQKSIDAETVRGEPRNGTVSANDLASKRMQKKEIENNFIKFSVGKMLPKVAADIIAGLKTGIFGSTTPTKPSDTDPKPAEKKEDTPRSTPPASPPTHAATTTEEHGTTGYTPDTAETEDIDEKFYATYIDWMSTLRDNMTPIMNDQPSTDIQENLDAIQSTRIFHPDMGHSDMREEDWTYSQNVLKEKQWTKWCEMEEELDAKNQDEYNTKNYTVSREVAELRKKLEALESDDDEDDPIKKDLHDELTIACSEQDELSATSIEKKRVVVVQAIVDSIEKISSSCVALQIAERMLASIATTENDHMTEDLKTLVGIDVEYGQYDNDHVIVATICKPPPATKPTKPTNPPMIYTGDSWDSILSTTRHYSESDVVTSKLVVPFVQSSWMLQKSLIETIVEQCRYMFMLVGYTTVQLPQLKDAFMKVHAALKYFVGDTCPWPERVKHAHTLNEAIKCLLGVTRYIRPMPRVELAEILKITRGTEPPLLGWHKCGPGPEAMGFLRLALLINEKSGGVLCSNYRPNRAIAIQKLFEKDSVSDETISDANGHGWAGVYKGFDVEIKQELFKQCVDIIDKTDYGTTELHKVARIAQLEKELMEILPGVRAVAFATIPVAATGKHFGTVLRLVLYFDNMEETPHFYSYLSIEGRFCRFFMVFVHDVSVENLTSNMILDAIAPQIVEKYV